MLLDGKFMECDRAIRNLNEAIRLDPAPASGKAGEAVKGRKGAYGFSGSGHSDSSAQAFRRPKIERRQGDAELTLKAPTPNGGFGRIPDANGSHIECLFKVVRGHTVQMNKYGGNC
jgi:hypothetical protein